jgi:hypothetical protein
MPNPLSSYTTTLPTNTLLDSGVLYIGSAVWSAHEGGLEFDPGTQRRQVPFDGMSSDVVGLDRTIGFDAHIRGNVYEISADLVKQYEAGATLATITGGPSGATQVQPKPARTLYASGDYLSNVRAIWMRSDGTFVQVRFPKSLVEKWGPLAGKDREEVRVQLDIKAKLDMSVSGQLTSNPPFVIEFFAAQP